VVSDKERKKNAAELRIEPASRNWQADTLTTQPPRLIGVAMKPTEQNLVLSRIVPNQRLLRPNNLASMTCGDINVALLRKRFLPGVDVR